MTEFPGFPTNDFDFHFEEAGGALAGLLLRDPSGNVLPGVLPHSPTLLAKGSGWSVRVSPFVAARSKERSVLLGGATSEVIVDTDPAPSANSRIDVIYSLPADVGAGDPVRAVAVAKGLAGAVPAKPSIPDGAIELGTIRSSAGQSSIAQATLVETFRFAGLSGSALQARTKAHMQSSSVMDGVSAYCHEDKSWYDRAGGVWHRRMKVWSTIIQMRPTKPNVPIVQKVTFPAGLFTENPGVTATPWTSVPTAVDVTVGGATKDGVDVYLSRINTGQTGVYVVAVGN